MKCHYEVLGVAREATAVEIKTSYRRLALQWHPDKNPDNLQEAKEQFQSLQNAYEVLSDPQERAWYDNHREQLLRGAGSTYNDSSLDVFPYFSPSCYKGFGDDPQGFFAIYSEVFSKLAAEETDFLEDPEDLAKIPKFASSTTEYERVHEFYAFWTSFSTTKSYVWLDQYQVSQGDNRRVIKLMEKENSKVRQKARKERNEEVRRLASFARRRDPRVHAHTQVLQARARQNKIKAEQVRRERILERQREIAEAAARQGAVTLLQNEDYARKLAEMESQLQETFGISSDDSSDGGDSSDEENSSNTPEWTTGGGGGGKSRALYCSACNKLFKNYRSFENHERSHKHRDNVAALASDLPGVAEEQVGAVTARADGDASDARGDKETLSDESVRIEISTKIQKKKKRRAAPTPARVESEGNDSHDEMSLTELSEAQGSHRTRRAAPPDDDKSLKRQKRRAARDRREAAARGSRETAARGRREAAARGRREAAAADTVPAGFKCAACDAPFPSKNKLFEHLERTRHAVPQDAQQPPAATRKSKKANR